MSSRIRHARAWPAAGAAAIVGLALFAYGNSFRGPFVWDDIAEIEQNTALDTLWPPKVPMFQGGRLPHRPLPYYTFALNRTANRLVGLAADDPRGFHAVNLAIHLVNATVVWWLVSRGLRRLGLGDGLHAGLVGWTAAAIWLAHPLNTQAVTYVYQRIESLAAGFTLGTLACFVASLETRGPRRWLAAAVGCAGLGMASKETAVVAPLLVAAYAILASHPDASRRLEIVRRHVGFFACLAATWALLAAVVLVQRDRYPELGRLEGARWTYAANQPAVILHYLKLAVWPQPLLFDPDWPQTTDWRRLLPAWLALAAAVGLAAAGWRGRRGGAFVVFAFLLALAPSSSFIPASANRAYAEYRMYLPLAFAVTGVVAAAVTAGLRPRILLPVGAAVAVLLAGGSRARNEAYATGPSLWADTFAKQPDNRRALHNLVTLLLQGGHDDVVLSLYEGLGPAIDDHVESLARKSNLLEQAGRTDEAAATAERARRLARETLRRDPTDATAWYYLGNLTRDADPAGAAEAFRRAARLDPRQADARSNLGALVARTRPDESERLYREALAIDPAHADAHANLGVLLARRGDLAAARRHLEEALRHEPSHEKARINLRRLATPGD